MRLFFWIPLVLSACDTMDMDSGDTGMGGDPADTGETADTGDTADTNDLVSECTTEACGGDPTGEWTIADVCFDGTPSDLQCEGSTIRLSDISMVGTLSLNADGTYTNELVSGNFESRIDLPSTCLDEEHPDCASVQAEIDGYTCEDDGSGGCVCTGSNPMDPATDVGTWSVSGTDLSLDAGNGADTAPYCNDTDELWVDLSGTSGIPIQVLFTR
ncbi:hypothetical protein LBMAG42_42090 [Deltaproteobacteria bacterium]|nr:hypothetical protein LBMAG42_42090 [Deltaproteobacteria bacterium]